MQPGIDLIIVLREVEDGGNNSARYGEDRIQIPRALSEPFPGESDNAYSNISDVKCCEYQENIIWPS